MKLTRKQNEKLALSLRRVSVSFRYQSESQTTLRLFDCWIPFSLCPFSHLEDYFLGDIVYLLKCFLSANEADLNSGGL